MIGAPEFNEQDSPAYHQEMGAYLSWEARTALSASSMQDVRPTWCERFRRQAEFLQLKSAESYRRARRLMGMEE